MCCFRYVAMCAVLGGPLLCVSARAVNAADPPRLRTFVASGDRLLEDLQFLTVDLAQENKQWSDNIYPSIDIFLVGVETREPIRFDILMGANNGQGWRYQPSIPIANLKTFIEENLQPIGIDAKRKDRRGTFYELSGGVYDGGMRIVEEDKSIYACIAAKGFEEDDIPKEMLHPSATHQTLVDRGFDIAAELLNDAEQMEQRDQDFLVFQQSSLAQVKKRPDETKEVFALRELSARQQLEVLHRAYVEAEQATVGWTTDVAEQAGRGDFFLSALGETSLAEYLMQLAAEPSRFAALARPSEAVVTLRVNMAIDEFRQKQQRVWYETARPVLTEKIAAMESRTDAEKAALQKIATQVFDIFVAGIELGKLDLIADISTQDSGLHTLLIAVEAKDAKAVDAIVKLLPEAHADWSVETEIEQIGDVAIHKVDVSKDTVKSLVDFFGDSGAVYVGTSPSTVWVAAGDKSLETLRSSIETVANTEDPPASAGMIIDLKLHALPLVSLADSYINETGFDLVESLNLQAARPDAEEKGEKDGPIGAGGLKPIEPAELRAIAIKALQDIDDSISIELQRIEDHIEGSVVMAPGPLRTIGKVIAKVAADNL